MTTLIFVTDNDEGGAAAEIYLDLAPAAVRALVDTCEPRPENPGAAVVAFLRSTDATAQVIGVPVFSLESLLDFLGASGDDLHTTYVAIDPMTWKEWDLRRLLTEQTEV